MVLPFNPSLYVIGVNLTKPCSTKYPLHQSHECIMVFALLSDKQLTCSTSPLPQCSDVAEILTEPLLLPKNTMCPSSLEYPLPEDKA